MDPDGRDIWEKIKNFVSKGEWRDDSMQENFQQRDWKNATPQVATAAGINLDEIQVKYVKIGKSEGFYTETSDDNTKVEAVITTKAGFEKLNESNIENSVNSLAHENSHVNSANKRKSQRVEDRKPYDRPKDELKAVDEQRKHSSWGKTTPTYKKKIKAYEDNWIKMQGANNENE